MPDWFDGIERVGVAVTVLVFLGLGLWKAFRFMGLRLLGDAGIVTVFMAKFVQTMDVTQNTLLAVHEIVKRDDERSAKLVSFSDKMLDAHGPDGACNPAPLKRAGLAAADAIVALADGDAAAVRTHAAEIKRHLEPAK